MSSPLDTITMFDIAVIAVIAISGVLAYARGFVHEALSIAKWIGSFFVAMYGKPALMPYMVQAINDEFFAALALWAGLFLVSLVILSLVTRAVSRRVKDSALGALDRSLGLMFGLVRGLVIVCLAYIALEWVVPAEEQGPWIRDARTIQMVETGAGALKALAPRDAEDENADDGGQGTEQRVQQMLRDAITPKAKTPEGSDGEGYKDRERKELDRLFESNK